MVALPPPPPRGIVSRSASKNRSSSTSQSPPSSASPPPPAPFAPSSDPLPSIPPTAPPPPILGSPSSFSSPSSSPASIPSCLPRLSPTPTTPSPTAGSSSASLLQHSSPTLPMGPSPLHTPPSLPGPRYPRPQCLLLSPQPPFPVPSPDPDVDKFRPLAIVSHAPRNFNFKIFMVETNDDCIRTKVFNSQSNQWTTAIQSLPGTRFVEIRNASLLGTYLYCLCHTPAVMPKLLLKLNMEELQWEIVSDALPASRCLHILIFKGKVFLVGKLEERSEVRGASIWEINSGTKEWKMYCTMPFEFFSQLCNEDDCSFATVDCKGLLCFLNSNSLHDVAPLLMCDLAEKKWWWSRGQKRSEGVDFRQRFCFVLAVEPSTELLEV